MNITTVGIDLAKNIFQVHGVNQHDKPVMRKQLKWHQIATFFANLPPCVIGTEACPSDQFTARKLQPQPHGAAHAGAQPAIAQLARLYGIGIGSGWVLVKERFGWRHFDNRRQLAGYTVAAGDTAAVLVAIAKAKARCGLAREAPVRSCYEAGRDGFWLHRWLIGQGSSVVRQALGEDEQE